MASDPKWYGENGPFETISREVSFAESKTGTFTVVGKYDDLERLDIKPGDKLSSVPGVDAPSGNWFVRTCAISRDEGKVGTMTVSAVRVAKMNDGKPFNIVWQVSMEAVEKKLITHPHVKDYIEIIQKWEDTPAAYKYGQNKDEFYYVTGTFTGIIPNCEKITQQAVIDYCKAKTAGIESYNLYLPVVTKTTSYLELPGCSYDKDHVVTGGTIKLSDAGAVGCWDEPDIKVSCVPKGKGRWFKSMDSITENADGTSTRTEQWTYTNDDSHEWIYKKA